MDGSGRGVFEGTTRHLTARAEENHEIPEPE